MVVVLLYVPVLFIVLLHAVPVFFIAAWTESKVTLVLAAVVSGCIGVATGNPSYVVADLIGVAVGVALGFSLINNQMPSAAPQKETPLPAPPPAPRAPRAPRAPEKQEEDWFWIFIGAMLVFCAVLFFFLKGIEKPVTPPVPPPAQVLQEVYVPPEQPMPVQTGTRKHRNNSDLRHCLNLPTNAGIIRCADQGK